MNRNEKVKLAIDAALKQQFNKILNTKAKRVGVFVSPLLLIVLILSVVLLSNNNLKINECLFDSSKVINFAQNNIGADMATLDYASKDRVILHYSYALIIYDIKNSKVFKMIDLLNFNIPINTQGDEVIRVIVDKNGNEIFLGSHRTNISKSKYESYILNIDKNTISKTNDKSIRQPFTGLSFTYYITTIPGWRSIDWVKFSENERCYLVAKSGKVADIKIIFDNNSDIKEYGIF